MKNIGINIEENRNTIKSDRINNKIIRHKSLFNKCKHNINETIAGFYLIASTQNKIKFQNNSIPIMSSLLFEIIIKSIGDRQDNFNIRCLYKCSGIIIEDKNNVFKQKAVFKV